MIESSKKLWLALVLGAGLFSLSLMQSAWAINIRVTLVPNFDGTYDTAFPDGDKPAQPPSWLSTPSPVFTEGVASSYDVSADYASDIAVTLSDGAGCTLPTGVTVDNANKELDASTGTSDGTTANCTLVIDDGVADPVTSPAFSIVINAAAAGGEIVVNGAGGDDYTTIQAAANAAACGDTIQVKNGNYAGFTTSRNCTAGNEITVEAFPGHAPVLNSGTGGSIVIFNHSYWIVGEGLELDGGGTNAQGQAADGLNPILISASNNTIKGEIHSTNALAIDFSNNIDNTVFDGVNVHGCGTAQNNVGNDAGQCVFARSGHDGLLFYNSSFREGGHSLIQIKDGSTNAFLHSVHLRNDWDDYMGFTGGDIGNRAGSSNDTTNLIWRKVLVQETAMAVDSTQTGTFKFNALDVSLSQCFFLQHTAGGSTMTVVSGGESVSGFRNVYVDHCTIYDQDGEFVFRNDNNGTEAGAIHLKNLVVENVAQGTGRHSRFIDFTYCSTEAGDRGDWEASLFVDGLVIDANEQVRINDSCGAGDVGPNTLTFFQTNYPANFSNITIVDPNFVSQVLPTETVWATAWATASANFLPQATAALGTGRPLTQVNGVHTNDTTILVDDPYWFRDAEGYTQFSGDAIFLCGQATTVVDYNLGTSIITIADAVTCADKAPIWRGTDASPNMGAVL